MSKTFRFKVSSSDQGRGLLSFLRLHCVEASSVKALKRAIEQKKCLINGKVETFSTHKLHVGDVVTVTLQPKVPLPKISILYEDEALLLCNKPAGVVCDQKTFPLKGILVHRLDKETSGLLMLAKKRAIFEVFVELFSSHQIEKSYLALVDGNLKPEKGKIESFLAKVHAYQGQTLYGSKPHGQKALTYFEVLSYAEKASLVLCKPVTGRTHQLRVHLKEKGHPILGDHQYGKNFSCPFSPERHLLHAWKLTFPHPVTQKKIECTAPLPADFQAALKALKFPHLSLE